VVGAPRAHLHGPQRPSSSTKLNTNQDLTPSSHKHDVRLRLRLGRRLGQSQTELRIKMLVDDVLFGNLLEYLANPKRPDYETLDLKGHNHCLDYGILKLWYVDKVANMTDLVVKFKWFEDEPTRMKSKSQVPSGDYDRHLTGTYVSGDQKY